ncbi:MAG: hypothetical protein GX596_01025 [Propionibacterium sp.]|nr:hypothetical protein [Propionibacterium sp.]
MTRARILVCVALALALAYVGFGSARADDGPQGEVTITSITPDGIDADATVSITGMYTNSTTTPLTGLTVSFWQQDAELASFSQLDVALATPSADAAGTLHGPATALVGDAPLVPGASVAFTVTAPASALDIPDDALGAIVGVRFEAEIISEDEDPDADAGDDDAGDPAGERVGVGRARALIPQSGRAFDVVDVNLLTAPAPPQVHGANPVDAQFVDYLSAGLVPALDASEPRGVITVIDPAIYQAASRLADDGNADALTLVDTIDLLHEQGRLWRLPQGNPNLLRMPEELRAQVPDWADDAAPAPLASAPAVAIVPDGASAPAGFDDVLTFGTDLAASHFYHLGQDAAPIVLDDDPTGPTTPPAGLPVDSAPWPALEEAIAALDDGAPARADLTTEPGTEPIAAIDTRPLIMSSYSTNLPSEAAAVAHLESSRAANFDPRDITFTASPSFVMGARTNEFPTTITNATPFDVYLRVAVRSENTVRLVVPNTDILEVRSGESLTAVLTPQASANGVTTVHAQLESQAGQRFGPEVPIEITATEFGRVGWIIIIVSGAVVLGGTVWRIRKVQRERAKEEHGSGQ